MEKVDTFSNRLKMIMRKRNISQSKLVNQTGINKGALSSYINGRYEPKFETIHLLSEALNVHDYWLEGYDFDPNKEDINEKAYLLNEARCIFEQLEEKDFNKEQINGISEVIKVLNELYGF